MPDRPNKLFQFWQELKRRKVVRVITVYAAAAFVILQLIEILEKSIAVLPFHYYNIEGSLERQNEMISIQVQIIQASNDDHIWADEFIGN